MIEPLPRIAGDVVLRRLAAEDLRAFQAYRHDTDLGRYQGWVPTPDEDALEMLSHMGRTALLQPGVWCQIAIAEPGTLDLIGDIGLVLSVDSRQAEIGFTLRRESQGRGLATSAVKETIRLVFENTRAGKVIGIADARNVPCIGLLERVGMCKVETRSATFRGEACTELIYGVDRHTALGCG